LNDQYIEFKNITKKFDNLVALDNVSLTVPQGCFMTLLGPSGCGKTTLMRLLAGFIEPDNGEIYLNGGRVNGLPPYKRNTPLVFQEYALFPHMTVFENISYGLGLKKTGAKVLEETVGKMIETFNLAGLEKRFPRQLSGGQQQRVAFARALIMGEEVLLLDEPLSNLDAKLRIELRSELRQIQRKLGITVIYVTHDQDEALSMSDRIAVMRSGRIMQIGAPWEIYFQPANAFLAGFIGTVNLLPVVIEDADKKQSCFSWRNHQYHLPVSGFSKGENALLMVRPEAVMIKHRTETMNDRKNFICGRVTMSSFLGRYIRYWVRLDGAGENPVDLIVDDANPDINGPLDGLVELEVDAGKLHLLKANEEDHRIAG
jgi:ABC-type Fe3+/spermidine/putrescine transport system ATPase subunit